jgi:hypothetical protein
MRRALREHAERLGILVLSGVYVTRLLVDHGTVFRCLRLRPGRRRALPRARRLRDPRDRRSHVHLAAYDLTSPREHR